MRRRIFNILAAVSLVLCVASAGLWVRSYYKPTFGYQTPRAAFACFVETGDLVCVSRGGPVAASRPPGVIFAHERFGLRYGRVLFRVPCWFLSTLAATLPAIWLRRYRCDRRLRTDGMPHCPKCDYNLTGNVSGICPECGTPIPADLVRRG